MKPRSPRFGQEGGELSYGIYLHVPELLELQTRLSSPPAHDELLFIIVHQAYELWFREVLFELETVRSLLVQGETHRARHLLGRVHSIERVLIEQIAVWIRAGAPYAHRLNTTPAGGIVGQVIQQLTPVFSPIPFEVWTPAVRHTLSATSGFGFDEGFNNPFLAISQSRNEVVT